MPRFRILFCALALAFAAQGCDTPAQPPEPSVEIGEKVEDLSAEVAKTRAEAEKRVSAAATVDAPAKDAGPNSEADAP